MQYWNSWNLIYRSTSKYIKTIFIFEFKSSLRGHLKFNLWFDGARNKNFYSCCALLKVLSSRRETEKLICWKLNCFRSALFRLSMPNGFLTRLTLIMCGWLSISMTQFNRKLSRTYKINAIEFCILSIKQWAKQHEWTSAK